MTCANPSYASLENGQVFEYILTIRTRDRDNHRHLAESLSSMPQVRAFFADTDRGLRNL